MAPEEKANPEESLRRMSFGDHLEELRKRLLKSIAAIARAPPSPSPGWCC